MKIKLITLLLFVVSTIAYSQNQPGIVRTIGTSNHHGVPIAGATIKVKGNNQQYLSDNKGAFSLSMHHANAGDKFQLLNVIKRGYELADKDFLSRTFAYSSQSLLEIVLISTEEMQKEKQAIEDRVFKIAKENYEKKLTTLKQEQEQGLITIEDYRAKLKTLQDQFDTFDEILSAMAEHYARTDYDRLDSLDVLINTHIINGELEKADMLVAQKGNLDDRIAAYQRHAVTNEAAREMLGKINNELKELHLAYEKERDDIANDLYNKYTIALSNFDIDNAGKYISLRSDLDTANIKWMYDAGMFYYHRTGNYEKSASLLKKAALLYYSQYGGWGMSSSLIIKNLAQCYAAMGDNELTASTYNDAIIVCSHFKGMESEEVAEVYSSYATYLNRMGEYQNALEHITKAVEIKEKFYNHDDPNMFITYNNMGMTLFYLKRHKESLEYFNRCLTIKEKNNMKVDANIATLYNNIGALYSCMSDFDNAEIYLNLALKNRMMIFGEKHKDIANTYNNIGGLHSSKGEFEAALSNYVHSYNIYRDIYGDNTDAALTLSNVGRVYDRMNDFRCVEYYAKALSIYWNSSMNMNNESIKEIAVLFYKSYCNGVAKGAIDTYQQYFNEFVNRYVVLLSVETQDSPAYSQGMRGDYILLGVNEWSMNKPESIFSVIARYGGKRKDILVYDVSGFNKYTFVDRIGARLELLYLGEEKIKSLLKEYDEWTKANGR